MYHWGIDGKQIRDWIILHIANKELIFDWMICLLLCLYLGVIKPQQCYVTQDLQRRCITFLWQEPAFQELILLYTDETAQSEKKDKYEMLPLQLKIYEKIPIPDLPVSAWISDIRTVRMPINYHS